MNYGLYYACFVSDCYHPPIVSSMNTQSIKKKSNNFSISIRQSVKQPSIMDYVILFVFILLLLHCRVVGLIVNYVNIQLESIILSLLLLLIMLVVLILLYIWRILFRFFLQSLQILLRQQKWQYMILFPFWFDLLQIERILCLN